MVIATSTLSFLAGYSPGDRPLAGYSDNSSGGECLLGYKMVLYVQSNDPPTTTEPTTTPTTEETTTTPLITTTVTTPVEVTSTEPSKGTLVVITENTTSGTAGTSFNLNYLPIIALLCLWYVSQH